MFDGYFAFGGVEIINTERLQAYIDNGLGPNGAVVTPRGVCEGLTEAMFGVGFTPYRTPIQDQPPWYDENNSDTWDFVGLLPLEVTGFDDTTRTVEMTRTVREGALPGRARRGPKTIGVTAMLIGSTTEGVQAGLDWLRLALHGGCDTSDLTCGPAATIEGFTVCPGPITSAANTSVPPVTLELFDPSTDPLTADQWSVWDGEFGPLTTPTGTLLSPFPAEGIVAGDAGPLPLDAGETYSGGTATPAPDLISGGTALPLWAGPVTLAGGRHDCTDGPVTVRWFLDGPPPGEVPIELGIMDNSGNVVHYGPKFIVPETDAATEYEWLIPFGIDTDLWRPVLIANGQVGVSRVEVDVHLPSSPLDCIAPYRRFFPNAVVTSGPTPVEVIDADCSKLIKVEWTWETGSAHRYGVTNPVLAGLGFNTEPTYTAPGVTAGGPSGVTPATPWNCAAPVDAIACYTDPGGPGFLPGPALPSIADPNRVNLTTQSVRDAWFCLGPEQTPATEGVLTVELATNGVPVVGARVRVWDNAQGDCTVSDPCDFVYDFNIDYVPANGVLTIDGVRGTITTVCQGEPARDSSAGVRGAYGGPIEVPVLRCDRRYLVHVMWLDKFPRTVPGVYTSGAAQGVLTVAAAITSREG